MRTWLIINSVGLLTLASVLYLTIRQVGLILGRLGPIGARSASEVGPRVGENVSPFLEPANATIKNGKPTLYVFGSESCGICASIKAAAESLMKYWAADANIALIYDAVPKSSTANGSANTPRQDGVLPIFRHENLRQKVGVEIVPFGMMVDASGVVLGKGLVNEMSHLESLLELPAGNNS